MCVQLINIEDEYEINVNMYVLFSVLNYIEHKFTWNKNKSYNITFSDTATICPARFWRYNEFGDKLSKDRKPKVNSLILNLE
jgi:hypothetical protein